MNYTIKYKLKVKKVGIHYTIFELIHNIKREIEQYNTGRDENTLRSIYPTAVGKK